MRQRCAFLAVSAVLLAWVVLADAARPVRAVRLAPEMEEILSEEGEAAFYRFFNGLQVWYAGHSRTAGGVTLTVERDYDELADILRDETTYLQEVEIALETAPADLREWADSYNVPLLITMITLPLGPMTALGQGETVTFSGDGWTALGEFIDALTDCYQ